MFCQTEKLFGSPSLFDINPELKWSWKLFAKIFSKFQSQPKIILTEGSGACNEYNLEDNKSIDDINLKMSREDQQLNFLTCCALFYCYQPGTSCNRYASQQCISVMQHTYWLRRKFELQLVYL